MELSFVVFRGFSIYQFFLESIKQQIMAYKHLIDQVADKFILKGCDKNSKVETIELNYRQAGKSYAYTKSIIPTFNRDKLHFTPAFLLSIDQKYYQHNETFQRYQFNQKVERNLEPLTQNKHHKNNEFLKLAAPNSIYCQVCQQKYENYFKHVALESHIQTAKNNPINIAIQQLCKSVKAKGTKQARVNKNKYIKKQLRNQKASQRPESNVIRDDFVIQGSASFAKSANQSTILSRKIQTRQ